MKKVKPQPKRIDPEVYKIFSEVRTLRRHKTKMRGVGISDKSQVRPKPNDRLNIWGR